jgi:hypothetical protein
MGTLLISLHLPFHTLSPGIFVLIKQVNKCKTELVLWQVLGQLTYWTSPSWNVPPLLCSTLLVAHTRRHTHTHPCSHTKAVGEGGVRAHTAFQPPGGADSLPVLDEARPRMEVEQWVVVVTQQLWPVVHCLEAACHPVGPNFHL